MTTERILRDRGDWLGASCVCRYRDVGFLLAGHVRGRTLVLGGVGGKVDPGETFRTATLREFEEETGQQATIMAVPAPRHLSQEAIGVAVPQEAGALLATRVPDGADERLLWIAVFVAALATPPQPVEKVPYFVVVPPEAMHGRLPELDALAVVAGTDVRPARDVLPTGCAGVEAVLTARAVLTAPGLLRDWWRATGSGL